LTFLGIQVSLLAESNKDRWGIRLDRGSLRFDAWVLWWGSWRCSSSII